MSPDASAPAPAAMMITATVLRDVVQCERRAWHDVWTASAARDPVAVFVELLWTGGVAHERDVLAGLGGRLVDLRQAAPAARAELTLAALLSDADHILGGELTDGDLLGRPDVISRIDGRWVAGDVKAGSPFMPDGVRVRREYGVQIGLYARLLGSTGLGADDRAFVIGADGSRVVFDLRAPWGSTTMFAIVEEAIGRARLIAAAAAETRGAASAICGLCHWRTVCRAELERDDDPTLLPEVGRSLRDALRPIAATRSALAALDVHSVRRPGGRTAAKGIGAERLSRMVDRARLQVVAGASAYARRPLGLARSALEWHLDIEADPTRGGLVYLHGIWERRLGTRGSEERFIHFFGDGLDGERAAFADAWSFLASEPSAAIYYYSPFERTSYRALQRRHPDVCSAEAVEALFASGRVIDLYTDVVRPHTEWPLQSYGLKSIAKSLGFSWAAEDASGASSIGWYDEWVRRGDVVVRDKIIRYNMEDCIASAVVLDGLVALPLREPPPVPAARRALRQLDGAVTNASAPPLF